MIYLLAILWFASGFFGYVFWHVETMGDFKVPSEGFAWALLWGVCAPLVWLFYIIGGLILLAELAEDIPQITLFKARNK